MSNESVCVYTEVPKIVRKRWMCVRSGMPANQACVHMCGSHLWEYMCLYTRSWRSPRPALVGQAEGVGLGLNHCS